MSNFERTQSPSLWLDFVGSEIRYVDTPTFGRIRMAEAGPKDAPAILFQHGIGGHRDEASLVDRHDRTVPALMLAPARGFNRAGEALAAIRPLQPGVAVERRQPGAVRHGGAASLDAHSGRRRRRGHHRRRRRGGGARRRHQVCFAFRAEDAADAFVHEAPFVQRRIQSEGAQRHVRRPLPQPTDDRQRQPRRGMHRQRQNRFTQLFGMWKIALFVS